MKKNSRYGQAIPFATASQLTKCDCTSTGPISIHSPLWTKKTNSCAMRTSSEKKKRTGVLCRVIVHPDHRRQGLGKAFCRDLLNWAKKSEALFENSSQHLWAQQSGPDLLRSLGVSYRQGRAEVPESRRAVEGFGNHGQKPALVQCLPHEQAKKSGGCSSSSSWRKAGSRYWSLIPAALFSQTRMMVGGVFPKENRRKERICSTQPCESSRKKPE